MSIFHELCLIAVSPTVSEEIADAVNKEILATPEGKEAAELLETYQNGRVTLAEVYVRFITLR